MNELYSYLIQNSKKLRLILSLSIGFLLTAVYIDGAYATQKIPNIFNPYEIEITGCVKNKAGEPLAGVTIIINETKVGVITDINGNFILKVPLNAVLTVSYIGYVNLQVKTEGKTKLEITLLEPSIAIGEVAVSDMSSTKRVKSSRSVADMEEGSSEGEELKELYAENDKSNFISAIEVPVSTFSTDADGASYANVRRFINSKYPIPPASVRIEEFLNYFTFDYPEPEKNENVSINSEITNCPWNKEHYLLRLGMKGRTIEHEKLPPSNYVFLIDVSSSMSASEKLDLLKAGFNSLVDNLRDDDRVSIITYSGKVQKLLAPTLGRDRIKIKNAIDNLYASGSTDGGQAIKIAYETALEFFIDGGNNRVILATDGDFNIGVTGEDELVTLIEKYLDSGVYLTVLGFGRGNLNDSAMEQIANHGNGNYEYIDCIEQLEKIFTIEVEKLYTIAEDSKIQIKFNPYKVSKYRLIGYENRMMKEVDFRNDKKDAGEIGVGQTITALYEIIPNEEEKDTKTTIAEFNFRYKKPDKKEDRELKQTISGSFKDIDKLGLSENQRFVSAVAMFGMMVRQPKFNTNLNKSMVLGFASGASGFDPNGYRLEFIELVKKLEIKKERNR